MPRKRRRLAPEQQLTPADMAPPMVPPTTDSSSTAPLSIVQQTILDDLKTKYDFLPAFTISSTQIAKRGTRILEHLRKDNGDPRPHVAFLHARPPDVCKMITIAEQVKRELGQPQGESHGTGQWFQYNLMYQLPPGLSKKETGPLEKTKLPGADNAATEESDDDDFEIMESRHRLERALAPEPVQRAPMSLSIFLARVPIPELQARKDITTQTNEKEAAAT